MDKAYATFRLGGEEAAARWIGISAEVYRSWPARLHPVMADRIYAAVLRRETAKALGMTPKQYFASNVGETVLEGLFERIAIASVAANFVDPVPPEYTRTPAGQALGAKRKKSVDDEEEAEAGLS